MISVERISELINDSSTVSPSLVTSMNGSPSTSDWPRTGAIKFTNVKFRYFENGPYVLDNLNFEIKDGEHIGIIGSYCLLFHSIFLLFKS